MPPQRTDSQILVICQCPEGNLPIFYVVWAHLTHQVGKHDTAADFITKALTIKPDYAKAHGNLGNAIKKLEKLDEAVASYHVLARFGPPQRERLSVSSSPTQPYPHASPKACNLHE